MTKREQSEQQGEARPRGWSSGLRPAVGAGKYQTPAEEREGLRKPGAVGAPVAGAKRADLDSERNPVGARPEAPARRLEMELDRAWSEAVYQSVRAGLATYRSSDGRTLMNRHLIEMLGIPVAVRTGLPCLPELRAADGNRLELQQMPCIRAIEGEVVEDQELSLLRGDRRRSPVLVSAYPVRVRGNELEGVVMTVHDISDRKQLEQLHQDYVGLVSHDLRTPLNVLMMSAELLRDELGFTEGSGAMALAVDKIARCAMAMRELVDDLLETAQLESGTMPLRRKLCVLSQVAGEALAYGLSSDQEQRVRWISTVEGASGAVLGDAARLRRAVLNLVTNALKFSPTAEPVEIEIARRDQEVILSVRDHGPGMSGRDASRVFEKYRSSPGSRRTGGVGLGLYTCRLITEAHGGRCWVETAPGQGATFHVALPAAR